MEETKQAFAMIFKGYRKEQNTLKKRQWTGSESLICIIYLSEAVKADLVTIFLSKKKMRIEAYRNALT